MSEDKKYPVQGTVTISAEEYRDLILTAEQRKNDAEQNLNRAWKAEAVAREAEKRVLDLNAALAEQTRLNKRYAAFVASDVDVAAKYCKHYKDTQDASTSATNV